jgi:hypothetical protein
MRKTCTKCGIEKDESEFVKRSALKGGRASRCRECAVKGAMNWNKANPDKVKAGNKKWRETHQEYVKAAHRAWSASEKKKESDRRWRRENPEKNLAAINRAAVVRLSTLKGRLSLRAASAIRSSLKKGAKANRHWEDLVSFTVDQLKAHLEKQFTPEMSWENYGTYWSIDHKIPVAVHNFERPGDIDLRLCWSLKNLQPMEKLSNISKGAKIDRPFQPSLAMAI